MGESLIDTGETGVQKLKDGMCKNELDRSSSIDLGFNLGDFIDGLGPTEEDNPNEIPKKGETLRLQEGLNYYGVVKMGNQYLPALTLQDEVAFNLTNRSRPFQGLDTKEIPTYLLAEFSDLLGLKYDNPNVRRYSNGQMVCKRGAFINMEKILMTNIAPISGLKNIDGYIMLYANNGKLLNTGRITDIGLFAGVDCDGDTKEEVLKFFNMALKNYIVTFLKNKPKTFKSAELGLISQVAVKEEKTVFTYGSGKDKKIDLNVGKELPEQGSFSSKEEYAGVLEGLYKKVNENIVFLEEEKVKNMTRIRTECQIMIDSEKKSNCIRAMNAAVEDIENTHMSINKKFAIKIKEELSKIKEVKDVKESSNISNDYDQNEKRLSVVAEYARSWVGTLYSQDPALTDAETHIDCSLFVQKIFKMQGVNLPRVADSQSKKYGPNQKLNGKMAIRISNKADTRPGDILFFKTTQKVPRAVTHTGYQISDTKMIHSSSSRNNPSDKYGRGVTTAPVTRYKNIVSRSSGVPFWKWATRWMFNGEIPEAEVMQAHHTSEFNDLPITAITYDVEEYDGFEHIAEKHRTWR